MVDTDAPASPADPVATTTEEPRREKGTGKDGDGNGPLRPDVKTRFTSESAREAVAKRVEKRRQAQPVSRVASIIAAIQTQQDLATSTSSTVPARDRTAAARALPSLYEALDQARAEEEDATRIPWDTMHPARLALLEWVLWCGDDDAVAMASSLGLDGGE